MKPVILCEMTHSREQVLFPRLMLVVLIGAACGVLIAAGYATTAGENTIRNALPTPGFTPKWTSSEEPRLYNKEDIFEHIDGEAELYFPYGFKGAVATMYTSTEGANRSVSADVYEMGSPLDAFGIYSNYRSPGAQYADIGSECHLTALQLMFCQDRYFVRLNAIGDTKREREDLLTCARAISQRLPSAAGKPPQLKLLEIPEVAHRTVEYVGQSLLGYSFLPRGIIAEATVNGAPTRVFVVMTNSSEESRSAFQKYAAYLREKGKELQSEEGPATARLTAIDPLHKGILLVQEGPCLIGASNLENPQEAVPVVEKIRARAGQSLHQSLHQR